jgi:hypothetical protein
MTVILPILIPDRRDRGSLVIAPNLRRVRPLYLLNLVDKLIIDNRLTQFLLRKWLARGAAMFRRIEMVPGGLYVFWGYRTLHANEACDPKEIRSTAVYHFGDPHAGSPLRRFMGRMVV